MILKIELENQKFLELDFEDVLYITGPNRKQMWQIFRSLFYYFNKDPKLTTNIYGENKIELYLDDQAVSVKNNDVYFINNRESIYEQMTYKKGSLVFEFLNSLAEDLEIDRSIETMNDESLRLEMLVQKHLDSFSDNLRAELHGLNYLDLLKNYLVMGYESEDKSYPLEFMETETLLDEFLKFLEFKLQNNSQPTWLVLYNLDSYVSEASKLGFITSIKELMDKYELHLIYLGNNLNYVPLTSDDIEKIVVSTDDFQQLLPYEDLIKTVKLHYPSELTMDEKEFTERLKRIAPLLGNKKICYLSKKDLVLLKVVNDILGYKTLFNLDDQTLNDAEADYLKD